MQYFVPYIKQLIEKHEFVLLKSIVNAPKLKEIAELFDIPLDGKSWRVKSAYNEIYIRLKGLH